MCTRHNRFFINRFGGINFNIAEQVADFGIIGSGDCHLVSVDFNFTNLGENIILGTVTVNIIKHISAFKRFQFIIRIIKCIHAVFVVIGNNGIFAQSLFNNNCIIRNNRKVAFFSAVEIDNLFFVKIIRCFGKELLISLGVRQVFVITANRCIVFVKQKCFNSKIIRHIAFAETDRCRFG